MKISYKGDYALKALLDLSYHANDARVVPITEISRRQNIPVKFLEQILLILKKAGYVDSKRGSGGGFLLSKPPKEIILGEIVRLVEGSIEPIVCGKKDHDGSCGEEEKCAFREVWIMVAESVSEIVDHVTFEDIMQRQKELLASKQEYIYHI